MNFKKILVIGIDKPKLGPTYWQRVEAVAEEIVFLSKDSPEIKKHLADTDCLLVDPFKFKTEKEHIDGAPRLKYIGVLATAYGKVDINYATNKKITVSNIPGYSTEAVAELVFGVILEHVRELERAKNNVRTGDYSESTFFNTSEINGKRFGVIGLGRIGSRVAELAKSFGTNVYYWSKNRKKDSEENGIKYADDVEKLLSECDFISIHLAFNKETELFMNDSRIQRIKSGAILINLAPNELVDFNALDKRLTKGDIVYIADHTDEMSPEQIRLLSKHKNCILYPPIGYTTKEATIAKQEIFVSNIENFLKGKLTNKVN